MAQTLTTTTASDAVVVDTVTSFAGAQDLVPAWSALHDRSATANPFTHPSWALAWARHFVAQDELFVLCVRRGGELIGVAPFFWQPGRAGRAVFRSLRLLGNGPCAQFTEIPGVLTDAEEHRTVLRAVVSSLQHDAPRWDWVKLTLGPGQGWFEPQWLVRGTDRFQPFYLPHATRACVVLDLPGSWEQFLAERKKNVRESIRRSVNRLTKRIGEWSVDPVDGREELAVALDHIVSLHEARSRLTAKPNHPTMFGQPAASSFYRDAVTAMVAGGQAEVSVLRCKGEIAAGLVALRSGPQVYVSVTGADPEYWEFGPGTILIAEQARRAIGWGARAVNLSAGPNQSKLRWSERLEFNHDFVVVGAGAASRVRIAAYSPLSALAALRRAAQWDKATATDGT